MDSLATKKPSRKRLGELLIEAGIVTADELPKGLEFAQKATDADCQAVLEAKALISEQGLTPSTALKALIQAKKRHTSLEMALLELGWRPRRPPGFSQPAQSHQATPWTGESQAAPYAPSPGYAEEGLPGQQMTDPGANDRTVSMSHEFTASSLRHLSAGEGVMGAPPQDHALPGHGEMIPQTDGAGSYEQPQAAEGGSFQNFPQASQGTGSGLNGVFGRRSHPQEPPVFRQTPAASGQHPMQPAEVAGGQITGLAAEWLETGDNYFQQNNLENAEAFYDQALSTLERTNGPRDLNVALVLVKLARALFLQGRFQPAEHHYCRALQIRESLLGQDHIAVAECLDALAEIYDLQSQHQEAEQHYLSALGIKEKLLHPENPELTASLKKLALISKAQGRRPEQKLSGELLIGAGIVPPEKVEEGLHLAQEQALPIGRALVSLHYLTDQDLQAVLHAQLLLKDGVLPGYLAVRALRIASQRQIPLEAALQEIGLEPGDSASREAIELLRAADELVDAEKELSPEHPDVAALCIKVADLYLDHSRYDEAEVLYKRGHSILEKQLGRDHLDTAETIMRLAELYCRQLRYDETEPLYLQVLDIRESCLGKDHMDVANTVESLAALHYIRGDFRESGRMYQLSLATKEKLLGPWDPGIITTLQGRANCYFVQGRLLEAEQLYHRGIEIQEKAYGPSDPRVAVLVETLGDLYFNQGQLEKAQAQYARGISLLSEAASPEYMAFSAMLEKLAYCYAEQKNYEKADSYYRQVLKTREKTRTASHPDMIDILERYGLILLSLERHDESEEIRARAQLIREMYPEQ